MIKISAVVSAYNEEKNIENCLKSLKFADELIVIDNGSTDETGELAKKYANKVLTQKNDPQKIDIQKNLGIEEANGDWVLIVDADEQVSEELAKEIRSTIEKEKSDISGYWIPRKNYIFGKWIENAGWYPDPQLRLVRKGKGKYSLLHVHEPIKVEGETGELKQNLIHNNYGSIAQFLTKTTVYAENEADFLLKNGYQFSHLDAIRFPMKELLNRFFARKGYKDGLHGLMLSILMAFYHFLIFSFIWEKKGFVEENSQNFLGEVGSELKKSNEEVSYWVRKETYENIKSPLKRNLAKIKGKISV
jgi:glycosyltransferase involved in cell wall biosynthesis